jgi:hypothetical protein
MDTVTPIFRERVGELGGHQIDLFVEKIEVDRVDEGGIRLVVRHELIGTWPDPVIDFKNDNWVYKTIQAPAVPYMPALRRVVEQFVRKHKDTLLSSSVAKASVDVENLDFSGAYNDGTRGYHCVIRIPVKKVKEKNPA